jgi:hypothetical protein
MKNRSQKRTLTFERLETKATPAALLIAVAPLDDASHDRLEPILQCDKQLQSDQHSANVSSTNWQFSHSVGTLLQFVDQNTPPTASETEVCAPPTWDQCRSADEMMKLHDRELRELVMGGPTKWSPTNLGPTNLASSDL